MLFGGLAKSGELLLKPLREAMERNMLSIYKGKVKVLQSELREADAAILGASALGWEAKPIGVAITLRRHPPRRPRRSPERVAALETDYFSKES